MGIYKMIVSENLFNDVLEYLNYFNILYFDLKRCNNKIYIDYVALTDGQAIDLKQFIY